MDSFALEAKLAALPAQVSFRHFACPAGPLSTQIERF
jgi:hypothetical protein